MTLLAKLQDLATRLDQAEGAKGAVAEAKALQALEEEIGERLRRIEALRARAELLRKNSIPINIAPSGARQKVLDAITRFERVPKSTTLRTGQRWRGLIEALDSSITPTTNALQSNWSSYVEQRLFGGPSPEDIEHRLPGTPVNKRQIERYRANYRVFASKKRLPPSTQVELDEVRCLSEELQAITFQEAEDVPESVRRFLDATTTSAGAGLTLVTPAVLDWLHGNDLLDKYMIKARSGGRTDD